MSKRSAPGASDRFRSDDTAGPTSWRRPSCSSRATPRASSRAPRSQWMEASTPAFSRSALRLGPPPRKGFLPRSFLPVRANRREDVNHAGAACAGLRRVRNLASNRVGAAYAELPRLTGDDHGDGTPKNEADLLVLVPVFGNLHLGVQVDESDGHSLAVDHAGQHTVPNASRRHIRDRTIDLHPCFSATGQTVLLRRLNLRRVAFRLPF